MVLSDIGQRDRAADDRERAAAQRGEAAAERERSQARDDGETSQREHAAGDRDLAASDRDRAASDRDHSASDRDRSAWATDRSARAGGHSARAADSVYNVDQRNADRGGAAEDRRQAASDRLAAVTDRGQSEDEARVRVSFRAQAATDREHDLADRVQATADRAAATLDRQRAEAELNAAQIDHLTGALGRRLGVLMCETEINRARHGDGRLILAYIDVDGLKAVNDGAGHSAGDALLVGVVDAIKKHLRSYDLVVRVGGDEFICMLSGCSVDDARQRFTQVRTRIAETLTATRRPVTISVGYASLRPEDTLASLTERADQHLYVAKRTPRTDRDQA